jgi:hypothetical protein
MYLTALTTALQARDELKEILTIATKAKAALRDSSLNENVFNRTNQMIENIIRDAEIAYENIDVEFDKMYGLHYV